jgi:hypothetical protein
LRAGRLLLGATVAAAVIPACYSAGGGTAPPTNTFYFPTGLAVSAGGNVLYAINSDFDLQWNGGTLQAYNLFLIRQDAVKLIQQNAILQANPSAMPTLQPGNGFPNFLAPWPVKVTENGMTCADNATACQSDTDCGANNGPCSQKQVYLCPGFAPLPTNGTGIGVPLGEACAPPVDSTYYVRDSAIVGAFATDLQLALTRVVQTSVSGMVQESLLGGNRLFAPLSGATAVAWGDLAIDVETKPDGTLSPLTPVEPPVFQDGKWTENPPFASFSIDCGTRVDGRCDAEHQTGNDPNSEGNTRHVTMPGEPFGMAQSQDGTALLVTSQTDTKTSLLTTGLSLNTPLPVSTNPDSQGLPKPTMQFVLDGLPTGGNGIAVIPHEPGGKALVGYDRCEDVKNVQPCVRPAFLQTSRNAAEVDLIRYYSDDGSTLNRPFLQKEAVFPLSLQSGGADFRGIAIDPTPRYQCAKTATTSADKLACAQLPARVYIASRTPPALVVGAVGQPSGTNDETYDPDKLVITGLIPLLQGPSKVFLAPIVDKSGTYALRVFVVCFDSNTIFVLDPNAPPGSQLENTITTGSGPFAMAFDPFDLQQVAVNAKVPIDPHVDHALALKTYRFAYVANFTQSFVQMIDLDQSAPSQQTFEKIVYTLGKPTPPKGS